MKYNNLLIIILNDVIIKINQKKKILHIMKINIFEYNLDVVKEFYFYKQFLL